MKQIISIFILLFFIPSISLASDKFIVLKAGKSFIPKEDLHCINNENALKLVNEIKLCKKDCEIFLEEAENLRIAEVDSLNAKILNQRISYQKIILQQEKMISEIKESIIEELDNSSSDWWKVTLAVVGGVLIGTAATATVISLTK